MGVNYNCKLSVLAHSYDKAMDGELRQKIIAIFEEDEIFFDENRIRIEAEMSEESVQARGIFMTLCFDAISFSHDYDEDTDTVARDLTIKIQQVLEEIGTTGEINFYGYREDRSPDISSYVHVNQPTDNPTMKKTKITTNN